MNSPTEHYELMKASLLKARKIVSGVNELECKSDLQHLKLQAYILISHSIFEEYLENLAEQTARRARTALKDEGKITTALVSLISTSVVDKISDRARKKVSSELSSNLDLFSKEAVNFHVANIGNNHGITSADQKNLFLPIGIDLEDIDLGLSQNLNYFGRKRGSLAHSFKLQREDTLSDVQSRIDNIAVGLDILDKKACQVCRV